MSASRAGRFGADWPHRQRSAYTRVGKLELHHQTFGSEAPRILLLHGTGASTHSMRDLAPELARHATVLVPDLPGHGESQTPPSRGLTIEGMASSVGELCDALHFSPDMIVGHSAGAVVGVQMAIASKTPPRAVVGLNAALEPMQGYAIFSPMAKLLFINPFVPSLFATLARNERTARRLIEQTGSEIGNQGIALYRRLFSDRDHVAGALGMMASWDLEALNRRIGTLRTALILVNAADDRTVPARNAQLQAGRVRNGRVMPIDAGGHLVHESHPEMIAQLILGLPELQALRDAA